MPGGTALCPAGRRGPGGRNGERTDCRFQAKKPTAFTFSLSPNSLQLNKRSLAVENGNTSWQRMRFKRNKVWMALDKNGRPLIQHNKVLIKYQLEQDYEYRVHPDTVTPLDSEAHGDAGNAPPAPKAVSSSKTTRAVKTAAPPIPADAVTIYTDGASSGNPGAAGIGVVMRFGDHEKVISKSIGPATNNIAELRAIQTALLELKRTDLPVRIYTDSLYAIGVLVRGWKPRKNRELVESIKKIIDRFDDLQLIQVRGHQGVEGNEHADRLARSAAQQTNMKK